MVLVTIEVRIKLMEFIYGNQILIVSESYLNLILYI